MSKGGVSDNGGPGGQVEKMEVDECWEGPDSGEDGVRNQDEGNTFPGLGWARNYKGVAGGVGDGKGAAKGGWSRRACFAFKVIGHRIRSCPMFREACVVCAGGGT